MLLAKIHILQVVEIKVCFDKRLIMSRLVFINTIQKSWFKINLIQWKLSYQYEILEYAFILVV